MENDNLMIFDHILTSVKFNNKYQICSRLTKNKIVVLGKFSEFKSCVYEYVLYLKTLFILY